MKLVLSTPFLASLMAVASTQVAEASKPKTKPRVNPRGIRTKGSPHRAKPTGRNGPNLIVGGEKSEVGEFPYYVDMNGCGGSLIAPGVVLSAAHCGSYTSSSVIVGGYEAGQVTGNAVQVNVLESAIHPQYDSSNVANDFMLLRLEDTVSMDHSTVQLSLNDEPTLPFDGQDLTVLGLGALYEGGYLSDVLMDVQVPVVNTGVCNNPSSYAGSVIDEVMFCAGYEEGGKDSCQGDSGGPIVIKNGDQHIQVGVVSWGYGCAREDLPGIYARVSSSMNWIKETVCGCWEMTDSPLCADFSESDTPEFECPVPPTPPCTLVDFPWTDSYGDGCDWYEAFDAPGCPEYGNLEGTNGYTANEACCHCQSTTEAPINEGCTVVDFSWTDSYGDGCDWYEAHDAPGCPDYGYLEGSNGYTANEVCCHCQSTTEPPTQECLEIENFDAGYGGCDTYAPGMDNHDYCSMDIDLNGVVAQEACSECGECIIIENNPLCEAVENYDAGYGGCDTYAPGMDNHDYCSMDVDLNGVVAQEACSECGKCNPIIIEEHLCEVVENYNAGYGGCDTYAFGKRNHDYCSLDADLNGIVAGDACPECGLCLMS